jgi:hypothetical protein
MFDEVVLFFLDTLQNVERSFEDASTKFLKPLGLGLFGTY